MSRRLGQEGFECVNGLLDGKGGTSAHGVKNGLPKIPWRKCSQLGPPKPQGPHRPVATLLGGRVFTGRPQVEISRYGMAFGAKGGRPVWISASSARAAGPKNGGDEMISGPDARS